MRSKKGNLIGVVVHRDFDYRSSKIKYINVNFWLEKMQNSLLSETFDFCHRIFLKSETYGKQFNKKILSDKCIKLPTPSHVNCVKNKQRSLNLRKAFAHEATTIIGTFGSFKNLAYNKVIKQLVPMLLSDHKERSWLFIGRGSEDFVKNLLKDYPHLENQVDKAGELNIAALSAHVQACDIMVHPYPRGVNTSRSSIMVSLSHGKPVITTTGPLTEPIWKESECVCLVPEKDITSILKYVENLQINSEIRQALSKKSLETYSRHFSLEECVSTLIKTFSEL
jgi:glycosyltransferase involved in cell wall biosynthesis